jgi:hypothetical protein
VSRSQGKRNQLIEYCRVKLHAEKVCVMGEQGRVQVVLYRGQVEGIILQPRMISLHQHGKRCQQQ